MIMIIHYDHPSSSSIIIIITIIIIIIIISEQGTRCKMQVRADVKTRKKSDF